MIEAERRGWFSKAEEVGRGKFIVPCREGNGLVLKTKSSARSWSPVSSSIEVSAEDDGLLPPPILTVQSEELEARRNATPASAALWKNELSVLYRRDQKQG